ncbi:MAG: hypothetical protein ABMA64_10840 [Myxococcota bacterium]
MPPLRIAVLANLKENAPPDPSPEAWAELDSRATVDAIVGALTRAGHEATFFEGDLSLVQRLPAFRPDLCFNLCEGHYGDSRESHVPSILEMLRLPYTGAGVLALAVTLDKPTTKRILATHGVPTPEFQVFDRPDAPLSPTLAFPLISKPAHEGSGMGVASTSVARDEAELRVAVARTIEQFRQPALVERFIPGREVTIGLVGNVGAPAPVDGPWASLPCIDGVCVLPIYELLFRDAGAYTGAVKGAWVGDWSQGVHYRCPAELACSAVEDLYELAVSTFVATGCRDVARVDLRLDASQGDRPYVLEINALPGLAPGWSDLCLEALAAGIDYDALIRGITDAAIRRVS